jgi:isopenicillin-N epimerase
VLRATPARVVTVELPLPVTDPGEVVDRVLAALTPRTRLLLLDHVTSPTALVFPVEPIVRACEARGVMVLVDGAHAPGMVPLALEALGASFYTGNLHKWVCAPKGAAFLYARADRQALLRPAVISHGANSPRRDRSRFQLEFDWAGTADPTPFLCVPAALDTLASLSPAGWPGLMAANREDALAARELLQRALGTAALAPPELVGAMAAVALPGSGEGLQDRLFHRHCIEVPIIPFGGDWLVRVSLQRHVRRGDVQRLADALAAEFSAPAQIPSR